MESARYSKSGARAYYFSLSLSYMPLPGSCRTRLSDICRTFARVLCSWCVFYTIYLGR